MKEEPGNEAQTLHCRSPHGLADRKAAPTTNANTMGAESRFEIGAPPHLPKPTMAVRPTDNMIRSEGGGNDKRVHEGSGGCETGLR